MMTTMMIMMITLIPVMKIADTEFIKKKKHPPWKTSSNQAI